MSLAGPKRPHHNKVDEFAPERARHSTLASKTLDCETQTDVDEEAAPHAGKASAADDEVDHVDEEEDDKPTFLVEEEQGI